MMKKLTGNAMRIISRTGIVAFFLVAGINTTQSQDSCVDKGFMNMVQTKVAGINIPGTDMIHGYLEYLPPGYSSNSKSYPLLIFFHGVNETGSGSKDDLCKLLGPWWWTPSSNLELGRFPHITTDPQGVATQFIVVTPQLVYFGNPEIAINPLLNYLLSRYRIDPSRVYLTGLSAGANFIQTFVGNNETSAKRFAAITPLSPCGQLTAPGANAIARTNVGFWSIQCSTDFACNGNNANYNVNLINSQTPAPLVPAWATTFPVPGQDCWPFSHDTWSIAYDSTFRQVVNGSNVNLYEWMLQFRRAELLPVVLNNFTATLTQGKVQLQWKTASEWNNAGFEIERAGKDQSFTAIATVASEGANGHQYEWIDEQPLAGLSFYRLVQKDVDGKRTYFDIKKILNQEQWDRPVMIAPNPVQHELTAWVKLSKTQTLSIVLMDLNGRRLQTRHSSYSAGTTAINLDVSALPQGVYVVKVEGEGFSVMEKVVKKAGVR